MLTKVAVLEHLGAILRRHGAFLGRLEAVFGRQRAVLGRLEAVLDRSWGSLGCHVAVLGRSWTILGWSWGRLEVVLGRSWGVMGWSWNVLGRGDGRVGGCAGQKNGMFLKWYYLHAFGTHNECSGACTFTKVYYLHASGRREPHHAHKSVLFTRNQGGAPKVDFGGEGMYINKEQG